MHKNTYKYCCNAYYFIYSRKNKHYKTMNREISENSIEFNKEDNFICNSGLVLFNQPVCSKWLAG